MGCCYCGLDAKDMQMMKEIERKAQLNKKLFWEVAVLSTNFSGIKSVVENCAKSLREGRGNENDNETLGGANFFNIANGSTDEIESFQEDLDELRKEEQELERRRDNIQENIKMFDMIGKLKQEIEEIREGYQGKLEELCKRNDKIAQNSLENSRSTLNKERLRIKQSLKAQMEECISLLHINLTVCTSKLTESGVDLRKIAKRIKNESELDALKVKIVNLKVEIEDLKLHKENLANHSDDSLEDFEKSLNL